jgi:LysM repeat protein
LRGGGRGHQHFGSLIQLDQSAVTRMEGYREGATYGSSTYFQPGSTQFTYDKNGYLTQVTDSRQASNNRSLVNNAAGQILAKQQNGLTQRTAIFSGQQLAIYGDGMANPILSPTFEAATQSAGGGGVYTPVNPLPANCMFTKVWNRSTNNGAIVETAAPNPVGNSGVRSYTVMAGDTLRSIAQSMYGTASLWWKIADANGLLGDAGLPRGVCWRCSRFCLLPAQRTWH